MYRGYISETGHILINCWPKNVIQQTIPRQGNTSIIPKCMEVFSSECTRVEVSTEAGCMYLKENLEFCMRRDERGGSDGVPFSPGVGNSLEKQTAIL